MKSVTFVREPGQVYNVFSLMTLRFNKEVFLQEPFGYQYAKEDTEYFSKVLDNYMPISDELLPFFYLPDGNVTFMKQYYYEPYKEEFLTGKYNVSFVLEALSDHEQVIYNLYKCYFEDITDEAITECKMSIRALNKLIKESKYDGEVKSALYSFFIDPASVLETLCNELTIMETMVAKQYNKNAKKIQNVEKCLDCEMLKKTLGQLQNSKIDFSYADNIYISVGVDLRQVIRIHCLENAIFIITGLDYLRYVEYVSSQIELFDMNSFGNAISEKRRMMLLEYIRQKKEVSIHDLEQALGITGPNAYYHLSLMIKGNMIKTRNRGRTVLYSINSDCFKTVMKIFDTYAD